MALPGPSRSLPRCAWPTRACAERHKRRSPLPLCTLKQCKRMPTMTGKAHMHGPTSRICIKAFVFFMQVSSDQTSTPANHAWNVRPWSINASPSLPTPQKHAHTHALATLSPTFALAQATRCQSQSGGASMQLQQLPSECLELSKAECGGAQRFYTASWRSASSPRRV